MEQTQLKKKVRLGDLLVEGGLITTDQLHHALELQKQDHRGRLLGEILVELGYTTEDHVVECLATGYGVPYASLNPQLADPAVLSLLPANFIDSHTVLPLFKVHNTLTIALPEPSNLFLIEEIEQLTGCKVQVVAATAANIARTTQSLRAEAARKGSKHHYKIDLVQMPVLTEAARTDTAEFETHFGRWSAENIVNFIIQDAHARRASEIHVEPDPGDLRIRYRIDGLLRPAFRPPHRLLPDILRCFKVIVDTSGKGGQQLQQGATASVSINGSNLNLHIWTSPARAGERMLIQLADLSEHTLSLERLGFDLAMLQNYRKVLARGHGLLIVAGPCGSGKTTTLYASILSLDSQPMNICTVENPIAANLPGINQFQPEAGNGTLTPEALRAVLRQSPDVLLLSNLELHKASARLVADAAMAGLLILAEVNAPDAAAAILHAIQAASGSATIDGLRAVLSQRLVRRTCPHCKQRYQPSPEVRKQFSRLCRLHKAKTPRGDAASPANNQKEAAADVFHHGQGCERCEKTGYYGRVGLFELVTMTPTTKQAVRSVVGPQLPLPSAGMLASSLYSAGIVSMIDDGIEKVRAGLTTPEEILRVLADLCPAD